MTRDFRKLIAENVLLFDGATGTMLQERGLKPGSPPESALLDNFDLAAEVHTQFAQAGAEVATTISFGANPIKLIEFGLESQFEEINRRSVRAARKGTGGGLVAGDIGPTGMFIEPIGDLGWRVAVGAYARQARILADEGVDLFIIETMSDIREIKAAVVAIKSVSDLPIVAMMTFDEASRTTLGTPPEAAAIVLEALGVDVIGSNCSVGPDRIAQQLEAMRKVTAMPLVAMPNAGLPRLENGKTVFPLSPEKMAEWIGRFLNLGCAAIGSCCGSTPAHTKAFRIELDRLGRNVRRCEDPLPGIAKFASRTAIALIGPGLPAASVGERINPTGRKALVEAIKNDNLEYIRNEARRQQAMGVDMIDINVGVPGIDEASMMRKAVFAVEASSRLPIVLDSADPIAIEAALEACSGKPLINSVRGERSSMKSILPIAKKYGAAVLGLCMDAKGVPQNAAERIAIARRIIKAAVKAGIHERDVLLDPVTVPVSADPIQAGEALSSLAYFSQKMKRATLQGISNVSFGLPRRGALNSAYMAMAFAAGLNAAFINPLDEKSMEIFFASRVLTNLDIAARDYIAFCARSGTDAPNRTSAPDKSSVPETWTQALKNAVIEGEADKAIKIVAAKLAEGIPPTRISETAMMPAIQEVGRLYETGKIFLPGLLLSAQAMGAGMELVNREIEARSETVKTKGVVALATVEGDIHDIGKNIVVTVLRSNGWQVVDLGKCVPAKKIYDEAVKLGADVVGLSALMTTTVVKMPEAIRLLHNKGIPVMVGGAVLTEEYAAQIGADFYGKDAIAALHGIEKLIK